MTIAALAPFRTEPVHQPAVDDDFARLYRHYRPQLLRYITHHFGPRDADEITQEALTRALRAMDRNRSEAETWAWLVRVARNVAHDLARARRLCETTDDDTLLASDVATDDILPEPAALLDERRRLVRRALRMLPPSQRRILVLYEVDELNCPAIARLVGSTEDAVRKALQRARRRFAAEVRALGGGAAGSVVGLLRWVRRPSKLAPASTASTALCALVGTVAVTVSVGPAYDVSPRLAPPAASDAAVADAVNTGRTGRATTVPSRSGGGATPSDVTNRTPVGEPSTALVAVPKNQLSPGGEGVTVGVGVYSPTGDRWTVEQELKPGPGDGVICSTPVADC